MTDSIDTTIVEQFKERMRITHSAEDDNLKRLLSFSVSAIKGDCGPFDIGGDDDIDVKAKELVFERTRYVYNDALEYFQSNFLHEINGLGMDIEFKRMAEEETTTTTTTTANEG